MAHKWVLWTSKIESWTQGEKFHIYKQPFTTLSTINTIGPYWQEKLTLLMNEKNRIHNPRKKKSLGALAIRFKMKKMCWIITKTNSGLSIYKITLK